MLWPAPQPRIFPSKRTDPISPPLWPGPAGGSGCPPTLGGGDGRAGTARGAGRGPGCGRGAPSLGSCLPPHGAAAPPLPVPPLQCVQGAGLAPLARRQAAAPRLPSSLTSLAFFSPFWTFSASPFPRYEAAVPPADAGRAGGAVDRRPPPPLLRGQEEAGGGAGTRGAHGGGKGGSGTGLGDGAGSPHGAGAAAGSRRHPRCPGKKLPDICGTSPLPGSPESLAPAPCWQVAMARCVWGFSPHGAVRAPSPPTLSPRAQPPAQLCCWDRARRLVAIWAFPSPSKARREPLR